MSASCPVRVHPRLRTMSGPRRLASASGMRRQSAMNARYFGLAGLFCGIASRLYSRNS